MPSREPDDVSFSVGVYLSSRRLTPADVDAFVQTMADGWKQPRAKELHPRLRSGVEGEHGVAVHVHLEDEELSAASDGIRRALAMAESAEVSALRRRDPDLAVEVDVNQNLRDVGPHESVLLDVDAVQRLAAFFRSQAERRSASALADDADPVSIDGLPGLSLDRYGAEGPRWLVRLMDPLLARRPASSNPVRTRIVVVDAAGRSHPIERWCRQWRSSDVAAYEATLARADDAATRLEAVSMRGSIEQHISTVMRGGLGLVVPTSLLEVLARHGGDLTIATRLATPVSRWRGRRGR